MEIILVYMALIALAVAVAGLFIPQKLVFWCAPDDRNRAMAFTTYLSLAIILVVIFIVIVPEPVPVPAPPAAPTVEAPPPPPALNEPIFLREVTNRLNKSPGFQMTGSTLYMLDFGTSGATARLSFTQKPTRKVAVQHATLVVEAMLATFKAYAWKLRDPFLIECQVDTAELSPMTGQPTRKSMGFARYRPETKNITWLDYD